MYTVNKIETFRPAYRQGKFTLIEKSENTIRTSFRSNNVHRLKLIILCLIFAINVALPSAGLAETYYVDGVSGNDSASGTINEPWKTIGRAVSTLQPGDTVLVREGIYRETVTVNVNGQPDNRITIRNYPGESPVMEGDDTLQIGFDAYDYGNYVTIEGFEIKRYTWHAVRIYGNTDYVYNTIIRNCKGTNISGNKVIWVVQGDSTIIEGCEVDDQIQAHQVGIQVAYFSRNIIVRNCTIYTTEHSGIYFVTVSDSQIINNFIKRAPPGGHNSGITMYGGCSNILVANNIAPYCRMATGSNITVYNNIFRGDGSSSVATWGEMSGTVAILSNTLLIDRDDPTTIGIYGNYSGASLIIKNNIVNGLSSYAEQQADRSHNIYTYGLPTVPGSGEFSETDLTKIFVDPDNENYHLIGGSPAIDAGTDVTSYLPSNFPDFDFGKDFEGNPRTSGSATDIGCYEYVSLGNQAPQVTGSDPASGSSVSSLDSLVVYLWDDVDVDEAGTTITATKDGASFTGFSRDDSVDNQITLNITPEGDGVYGVTVAPLDNEGLAGTTVTIEITLDTVPPLIADIQATNITSSGATITWDTDEDSNSQVEYGLDTNYGNSTALDANLVTSHSTVLTGLSQSTTYHFRVKSADTSGNESTSGDNTFTTSGVTTYTLNITAENGSVTRTPNQASYDSGTTVTLQAVANTGYNFVNWSGDVSGSSNPATIVMDADKSVTANFAVDTYTLDITATNGSVTKTPDQASYGNGTTVTLQATANTGYSFASWSGDASGTSNPTTVVMDGNKSVTANFTINTYTLGITATNGSVAKTPDQASYNHGTTVTLQATANTGYSFASWSGDASGSSNPATIVMDGDKSVTANFAINTYTLNITALNGSVAKTPDQSSYDHGTTVTLQATANASYTFANWSGDASGTSNPITVVMDGNKSITANFTVGPDDTAPTVANLSPQADSIQSPLNSLILLDITDSGDGVDANLVTINVNNNLVYTGNTTNYSSSYGKCRRIGNKAAYKYIYQGNNKFEFDQTATVTVNASDLAGNAMSEYSYSFISEMRSFGENKILHSGSNNENWGPLTTVADGSGNIWIAWPQGVVGSRDIYVGKLVTGTDSFVNSGVVQVTNDSNDQGNPVLAVDGVDKLYLAWQDNRQGEWDIYISTSDNWSTQTKITDPNSDQINPAIAVDSTDKVYVVWEDDQNSDKDIYIASSTNSFSTQVTTRITSAIYDQTTPAIAVDSDDTVYVVWTDTRNTGGAPNPKNDIYGAASNSGSWTNIPIVTKEESQSNPAIATEAVGSVLHLVWLDDTPGDDDIYYASTSDGLPSSPLTGSSIIDPLEPGELGTDQISPVIITTGTGNDLKVFACWRDERNADADLYAVEIGAGAGTNVFVGDDDTSTDQSEPAIGIDEYGHPYLVWINERTDICYAGSTFITPDALASENVSMSLGATVGTEPASISSIDDVSAEFPPGAYLCDVKVTISRIRNPHKPPSNNRTFLYEYGPSGTTFSEPVTITIPYNATTLVSSPSAYWYNPLTGLYSQEGITDVEVIQISSGLYALRFKTTHFSIFGGGGPFAFGGGGGGGGCSMSPNSQDSIAELLLPYIGLAVAMVVLKLRDRRKRKVRNITKSEC